jgi:hypothetical protein
VSESKPTALSQEELKILAGRIARLPDAAPPSGLVDAIMGRIQPKKRRGWQHWLRRLQTPWAVIPLRAVPAAVALVLIAGSAAFFLKAHWSDAWLPSSGSTGPKPITFTLDWPTAHKVAVIGSFNQWNPEGSQMRRDTPEGPWRLKLELSQGRYAYAFLIDDQWLVPDPHSLLQQEDGFGNLNSALIVENGKSDANEI